MRKWILAGLGLLLVLSFALGANAITVENETVASGTSLITITNLRGAYKILTVHPWTENVTVTVLDNNEVSIEDYIVEAGSWRNVDITGMGSAFIVRGTATVVDWGVSIDRDASIGGSAWQSEAFDSLLYYTAQARVVLDAIQVLEAAPRPVTTSTEVLVDQWATSAPTATTTNCVGSFVSGARALLLDFEWDATTTDFAFEYMYGISAADSTFGKLGVFVVSGVVPVTGVDTLMVDESDWADDHFTYEIPLGGSVAAGYLFVRVYAGSTVAGLDITVYKVW